MKKFSYTFDSILNYKSALEEDLRQKLGHANSNCENIKEKIKKADKKIKDNLKRQNTSLEFLLFHSSYNLKLNQDIDEFNTKLSEKNKIRDDFLKKYNKIYQEKKVFEILKEKQIEAYKLDKKRNESASLDEISSIYYVLNKN